ncbi:MAG: GDYXXLXY domain-containing protein [Candidatus Omnitrophica bacterium]|nr:GDYXXLXY domain-containing protein [Candidatus Omnitrophota bacterium]
MNRKTLILSLLGCLALIQIGVPVFMILQQESVLGTGQAVKFRTQPVDPFDAFRGRYVALSLKEHTAPNPEGLTLSRGQRVFAVIKTGDDGFAVFSRISADIPRDEPYLKVRVTAVAGNKVEFQPPIDRYYMMEKKAPRAEDLYRKHNTGGRNDAYVIVMIKDGNSVVKDLYVGGKPVEEALGE